MTKRARKNATGNKTRSNLRNLLRKSNQSTKKSIGECHVLLKECCSHVSAKTRVRVNVKNGSMSRRGDTEELKLKRRRLGLFMETTTGEKTKASIISTRLAMELATTQGPSTCASLARSFNMSRRSIMMEITSLAMFSDTMQQDLLKALTQYLKEN